MRLQVSWESCSYLHKPRCQYGASASWPLPGVCGHAVRQKNRQWQAVWIADLCVLTSFMMVDHGARPLCILFRPLPVRAASYTCPERKSLTFIYSGCKGEKKKKRRDINITKFHLQCTLRFYLWKSVHKIRRSYTVTWLITIVFKALFVIHSKVERFSKLAVHKKFEPIGTAYAKNTDT